MTFSDMAVTDLIILTAEFVGRGLSIPDEVRSILGPDLMHELENPEKTTNDNDKPKQPSDQ